MQPPAPKDLRINDTGDHFVLTWSEALGDFQRQWLSHREFEVVYRRLQDSWEVQTSAGSAPSPQGASPASVCPASPLSQQEASTLRSTSPEAILGPEHLIPSSTYVARVRTRLSPGSGLSGRPSQWSPEVRWDSQPGNGAGSGRCSFVQKTNWYGLDQSPYHRIPPIFPAVCLEPFVGPPAPL